MDITLARARLRWHAELGVNGFDTLNAEMAAENARLSLRSISYLLDDLDNADCLARVFGQSGALPPPRQLSSAPKRKRARRSH